MNRLLKELLKIVIPTGAARFSLPRRILARRAAQWRDRGTTSGRLDDGVGFPRPSKPGRSFASTVCQLMSPRAQEKTEVTAITLATQSDGHHI